MDGGGSGWGAGGRGCPTLFPRGIIIFQGVLIKLNILMKFPVLEKNCQFNEGPKI